MRKKTKKDKPIWRRTSGSPGSQKWKCPRCPWASVSFLAVEDHMEVHHNIPISSGQPLWHVDPAKEE